MTMPLSDPVGCHTLRLLLEYDGSAFAGFQRQHNAPNTVQARLEAALTQITGETVTVSAAGRTDAGVHATGQVVSLTLQSDIALDRLRRGLTALAGPDVAVRRIQRVPTGFHARYDATWRQYRYRLLAAPAPSPLRRYHVAWPGPEPLDLAAMQAFWQGLVGRHDFSAWQNLGSDSKHPFCRVLRADVELVDDEWQFVIRADRFLYRMVRNLIGTALRIGLGRLTTAEAALLLDGGAGGRGGPAAPALGLCLEAVGYDLAWDEAPAS